MASSGLRARKKERTRATITRIALELFARDGFAATTLSAIAEAADVSPRTVSTYFPSKEGLVFGGYEGTVERLRERLAARAPGESVVDAVGGWLEIEGDQPSDAASAMVRQIADDDIDFARLRQAAIARDPELWALQRRELRAVADLIADAAEEEVGDAMRAHIVGAATIAALMELNAHAARGSGTTVESVDVVLDFIRAGVATLTK